jgi:hypothetical protein
MSALAGSSLRSRATGSFALLTPDTAPDRALAELADLRYGVIVEAGVEAGTVRGLVTSAELRAAIDGGVARLDLLGLAPVVVVPDQTTFAGLAGSLAVTLLDLEPPALVLTAGGDRAVGVLPVEEFVAYLVEHAPEPQRMGPHGSTDDGELHGPPTVPLARVVCRADGCGHVNVLPSYNRAHPPACQNPTLPTHRLRVRG